MFEQIKIHVADGILSARREYLANKVHGMTTAFNNSLHHRMISNPAVEDSFNLEHTTHIYNWSVKDFSEEIKKPFQDSGWLATVVVKDATDRNDISPNDERYFRISLQLTAAKPLQPYR